MTEPVKFYTNGDLTVPGFSALGGKVIPSTDWGGSSTVALVADRVYYVPFFLAYSGDISGIIARVQAAAGTKMRCGLYEMDADFNPGSLLITSGDMDPSTTGAKSDTSFATQSFDIGWYYIAVVSDGVTTLRSNSSTQINMANPLGVDSTTLLFGGLLYEATPAWTTLPATAAATPTLDTITDSPRICLIAA